MTPDFKLDLKPKLPYQRQERHPSCGPKPPASAGRLPLAPLAPLIVPSDDAPNVGDVFDEVSTFVSTAKARFDLSDSGSR